MHGRQYSLNVFGGHFVGGCPYTECVQHHHECRVHKRLKLYVHKLKEGNKNMHTQAASLHAMMIHRNSYIVDHFRLPVVITSFPVWWRRIIYRGRAWYFDLPVQPEKPRIKFAHWENRIYSANFPVYFPYRFMQVIGTLVVWVHVPIIISCGGNAYSGDVSCTDRMSGHVRYIQSNHIIIQYYILHYKLWSLYHAVDRISGQGTPV